MRIIRPAFCKAIGELNSGPHACTQAVSQTFKMFVSIRLFIVEGMGGCASLGTWGSENNL